MRGRGEKKTGRRNNKGGWGVPEIMREAKSMRGQGGLNTPGEAYFLGFTGWELPLRERWFDPAGSTRGSGGLACLQGRKELLERVNISDTHTSKDRAAVNEGGKEGSQKLGNGGWYTSLLLRTAGIGGRPQNKCLKNINERDANGHKADTVQH